MEQELISKKELLERYSISYGALYRWKRKGLIPEEWFLKKSTVTGQETFFPKELVCERVALILGQKQAVLVLQTVYGEKAFYVNEIQAVLFDDGNGIRNDITKEILSKE